jgi:protein SCO1/2
VRSISEFRGHPVLITMFYGRCPAACPLLTSDLKRIERQLTDSARSKVRVLMVSFDAARDTPVELKRLMTERGMDATRWTLASANDENARELAGVLGIRYRKLDNGEFFHSSSIVALDAMGRPRARMDGVGGDVSALVALLNAS